MTIQKYKVLKNEISTCDYDCILSEIKTHVRKKPLLISPIASYTLVLAYYNARLKFILSQFDHLVPDSQWIRHTLLFIYGKRLSDRVYGPMLMLRICDLARKNRYKIFLYGTTEETLSKLKTRIKTLCPKVSIVGLVPSEFRPLPLKEKKILLDKISKSDADILFIGLGSPLQEIFSYELLSLNNNSKKPLIIVPVGAAFDFISGNKSQAPKWLQDHGLEWFFRLIHEPLRLWKRYLIYGPLFLILVVDQKIRLVVQDKLKRVPYDYD